MHHIALFASGTGSNAQKIIDYFRASSLVKVALVVCNKPGAGVTRIAEKEGIPLLLINRETFHSADALLSGLRDHQIDFIVLAGFLWKIPLFLIEAYPRHIINIHPALLPKYGGKGMYGHHVHEAVLRAGERESGISIHYVDEQYDHGDTVFQAKVEISPDDTVESLSKKIQVLEHRYYPKVIERILEKQNPG